MRSRSSTREERRSGLSDHDVPLAVPDIGDAEIEAVTAVLRRKWLTMGEETAAFEREFAALVGARHAIAVSNCTTALHLALLALNVKSGDEVLVPSLSFVATANAVRYCGATPVFVDVTSMDDWNVSVSDAATKTTARTRGILAVHYAGYPADVKALRAFAKERGLFFVEDAAQAIRASRDGVTCGTAGEVACFSFYSTKNATTGEGGMVTTNRDDLADEIRSLRSHGMTASVLDRDTGRAFGYDVVGLGYNYRMDEMRAALGRVQIRRVAGYNERRAALTTRYREALADSSGLALPFEVAAGTSSHHLMPVLLPEGSDRGAVAGALRARGVQTSVHYRPIHEMTAYAAVRASANVPLTEAIGARELTIPLFPTMTAAQHAHVVASLRDVVGKRIRS